MYSACIKRGSRNWRGINASRKYRFVETSNIPSPFFFFLLFGIKGESDFSGSSNKREGKFSVELEIFITVVILERETFPLGLIIHWEELSPWSSQRIIEGIFFFDESISGNLFESDERKVIREIQWSVEFSCSFLEQRPPPWRNNVFPTFVIRSFSAYARKTRRPRRKWSLID